jgi:hypothetical protein
MILLLWTPFISVPCAVFTFTAAAQLLSLRAWGRRALEAVAWTALSVVVGHGILVAFFNKAGEWAGIVALIGLATAAALAVPCTIGLRLLRSTAVRQAMMGTPRPDQASSAVSGAAGPLADRPGPGQQGLHATAAVKRPREVTRLGYALIAVAVLGCLSDVWSGVGYHLPLAPRLSVAAIPVWIALAVLAVSLLKLRAWARATLETITWLVLAWVVGLYVVGTILGAIDVLSPPLGDAEARFAAFVWFVLTAITAAYAGAGVLILRTLRSTKVRQAMLP